MGLNGDQPRVVIIGGGFGGLNAAQALRDAPVDITIIDRHLFQPLLYQVATASISPADIAQPIRTILRKQENVSTVLLAEAKSIDLAQQEVVLDEGRVPYDYLVIATGARHSYFGHDDWEAFAPGLKSLEDALEIRSRIFVAFEEAERTDDDAERDRLMTFVVVGGGPTGVELAGALGEISRHTLTRGEYKRIDPTWARIYLFEAGPRILASFPERLSKRALKELNQLGVRVQTSTPVTDIDADGVQVGEKKIRAATVLWAAGVAASPLVKSLGAPLDRAGRVDVLPDLSIPDHPNVFVIGDLASLAGEDGRPLPGVAQVAIQQGKWAAANIVRTIEGQEREPFHYDNKGDMATIGRNKAIANIRGFQLWGFPAWLAWSWIHIYSLIGFRNRLIVMLQWVWSYFTYNRGARLITKTGHRETREIM